MQEKKPTKTYKELNDTIGVLDYMKWRGVGRAIADEIFHQKDFPRLKGTGAKLIADKRAVLLYELGLTQQDKKIVLLELAKAII